jgi:fatty acid desaturase
MKIVEKKLLRELHKPSWATFRLAMGYGALLHIVPVGIVVSWLESWYVLLMPLILVQAFLMHAYLLALHEAAHWGLCPVGFINGYLGRVTGIASGLSLSLFRAVHHCHHAYLGTANDEEFWPFADPKEPRWKRRLAAAAALTCGVLWTPFVFIRAFLRRDSAIRERSIRHRIWIELLAMVLFWGVVAFAVAWFDVLPAFLVAFVVPAFIAGNMHTWRQFAEHIGLTGRVNPMLTRSIRHQTWLGRMLARSLFQEPLHDVHHTYPKVPQDVVPELAEAAESRPELPVFHSYPAAIFDALRSLSDPKFGKGWAETKEPESPFAQAQHALRDPA